jgi:hypothetical protein
VDQDILWLLMQHRYSLIGVQILVQEDDDFVNLPVGKALERRVGVHHFD